MKVLLNQDVDRLGRMGEVVEVADGYARNYLIPRDIAVAVTRGRVREIEERRKVLEVKAERLRQQLESVADRVRAQKLTVKARCSESGKLFGSITNRQLAAAIAEMTGEEIDRHKITIEDRIRTVGTYRAVVRLHHDVEVDLEFEVEGEGFVPEEPAAAGAEAPAEGGTGAVEAEPATEGDTEAAEAEAPAEGGTEAADAEPAGQSMNESESGPPDRE